MKVSELVGKAAQAAGSGKQLAAMMRKTPSRISEWKSGERKPDTSEIAYLAKVAGLPVLITVALVESELHPESAQLWEQALGEARSPTYWQRVGDLCILC